MRSGDVANSRLRAAFTVGGKTCTTHFSLFQWFTGGTIWFLTHGISGPSDWISQPPCGSQALLQQRRLLRARCRDFGRRRGGGGGKAPGTNVAIPDTRNGPRFSFFWNSTQNAPSLPSFFLWSLGVSGFRSRSQDSSKPSVVVQK